MHRSTRPLRAAFAALVACCGMFLFPTASAAEAQKEFDITADQPIAMLKQFSAQSGEQLLYAVDAVTDVKLAPVKGRMTPREALERMVRGTGLRVVVDRQNGALSLVRLKKNQAAVPATSAAGGVAARLVDGDALELERFEVLGVRPPGIVNEGVIPRREGEAMPFQVFDREVIERSGALSLADFFRSYSGNATQGLSTQAIYGGLTQAANSPAISHEGINLRGLGDNKTVVLLNGRRLYGSDTEGPDIARIPLSAIERIEVLTGSASAIYGANAIGGAVNIILRKDYRSGEATLYVGTSTAGGGTEVRGTVFQGFTSDNGKFSGNVTLEHTNRAGIKMADRRYYLDALARVAPNTEVYHTFLIPVIGGSQPILYTYDTAPGYDLGIPANPSSRYAVVPAGYSKATPVSADFNATTTNAALGVSSRWDDTYLQPPEKITSANLQGEYSIIKDRLGFYTELSWREQKLDLDSSGIIGNVTLDDSSPFNPFVNDPEPPASIGYIPWVSVSFDPIDLPRSHQVSSQRTRRAIAGLKGTLPTVKSWHWALDYSHDEDNSEASYTNYTQWLHLAVNQGLYNPVRDLRQHPNNLDLAQLRMTTASERKPRIDAGNLRLSGEVLTLPAGEAQMSTGLELRRERFQNDSVSSLPPLLPPALQDLFARFINNSATASREARAAYVELNVPLVGEGNRRPLIHELGLNAAARHEAYGRYSYRAVLAGGEELQNTSTPENISDTPIAVGLKYAPSRHFALRASWAQAFISPSMESLFATRSILANARPLTFFDPVLNAVQTRPAGSVQITEGGNTTLKPETGYSLNYGVVFTPHWAWADGLSLSFDYFRITNDNQVANPSLNTILASIPSRVTRDASNQVTAYDVSALNISRLVAAGFDAKFTWNFPAGERGQFTWTGQATYYDTYKRQDFPGLPFDHAIADRTFGESTPLRFKGQTALFWTKVRPLGLDGSFMAGVTGRYLGHYKDAYNNGAFYPVTDYGLEAVDGEWISSSMEFDVQLSYSVSSSGRSDSGRARSWLDDTRWTFGALNIADRRPPSNTGSFYSYYNDPRQRFVYFEVRKTF